MKCFYKNWPMHNIVAHPLMQVFNWLGMNGLATKVHDATLPSNARLSGPQRPEKEYANGPK